MSLNASINTTKSSKEPRSSEHGTPNKRTSNSVLGPNYSFTQEKLVDANLE